MSDELLEKAINFIRSNPNNLNWNVLKRNLHLGIISTNLLVEELVKRGIVIEHREDINPWIEVII